jgi:hypothetical protein
VLSKVEIFGLRLFAPTLPLAPDGFPGTDPLQLLNIEGLGPVKAAITTQPFGVFDGEAYLGGNVGKRNLVMTVGLNPDWHDQTMEGLRVLLYNYFMPKLPVRFRFWSTHLPTCQIDGYVESMDPNMFSKDPQIQISIICPIPDFIAVEPTVETGLTNDGTSFKMLDYLGSTPAGVILKVTQAVGNPGEDAIQLILKGEHPAQTFTTRGRVDATTYFEIDSIPGEKYVRSVSTTLGTITNYLNNVAVDAVWPWLYPGENDISVVTPIVGQNWELTYFSRFGGL